MKSSGISLLFGINQGDRQTDYLINLIDSPGHVDFSFEVSVASRLCDGAIVLVDAVEGVCSQTHTVLRQARAERLQVILVINKIDRLISELKFTPMEAYVHINKILEQFNAVIGTFEAEDIMIDAEMRYEASKSNEENAFDGFALDQEDFEAFEPNVYFSPAKGNVIFSSAIDGWAFRINQFSKIYARKLGIKEALLDRVLWGDYYLDKKAGRVVTRRGLKGRNLKPMFVQLILENVWQVYDAVLGQDKAKTKQIVTAMNLNINARQLESNDSASLLKVIMTMWLPLSHAVLLTVVQSIANPNDAQGKRLLNIWPTIDAEIPEQAAIRDSIGSCDASDSAPVVAYISKMYSVAEADLPIKKRQPLTLEQRQAIRANLVAKADERALDRNNEQNSSAVSEKKNRLLGFARIYSGTIKSGQKLYVLGPKYNPKFPELHFKEATVGRLFMMMGKDLEELESVPAGCVFALMGVEGAVLKSATLTSTLHCASLARVKLEAPPIVRVAVEPKDPSILILIKLK